MNAGPDATDQKVNNFAYWNTIYEREESPRWHIGVAPALKHWFETSGARPGRVLVPGCGYGPDAALLAQHSFEVTAVDFAPLAIKRAKLMHPDAKVDWRVADIFELPEREHFDYVYEYTCMVAIQPQRRPQYAQACHDWLRKGGRLIGCFYNHGREGGPPFDITREQVEALYQPMFKIHKLEVTPHSIDRRQGHELWAEFEK